jgi:hypothetical protein
VRFLNQHAEALKERMGTNPRCRRLGTWPPELLELVAVADFIRLEWESAREVLSQIKLSKYCDFNLRNMIHLDPDKHTFEVRILPVWMEAEKIVVAAILYASILRWAVAGGGELKPIPDDFVKIVDC